jgi:hypothetical protein
VKKYFENLFNMGDQKKEIEFLDKERLKAWQRIEKLEEKFDKGPAKFASEAEGSRNKISYLKNQAEGIFDKLQNTFGDIQEIQIKANATNQQIEKVWNDLGSTKTAMEKFSEMANTFYESYPNLEEQVTSLETTFSNLSDYQEKLNTLAKTVSDATTNLNRTNTVYQTILAKKNEIDEFYDEFLGWEEIDETTSEKKVFEGKKDEIENAISSLEKRAEKWEEEFGQKKKWLEEETQKFVTAKEKDHRDLKESAKASIKEIEDELKRLLPNALTAGLSFAYSKKKADEEVVMVKYENRFQNGVWGLIGVSTLPFIVSIIDIVLGHSYSEVLLKMPSLVLAILPLYIPVLWIAYSNNRKANLAKRLIEEYTHKEVLSKTFEGLSSQIDEIENEELYEELRAKLLFNLLEVNSENPGKLISDYNKSDHPVMDALDKSIKLTNAVSRLAKIPGFSRLAKILEKKADENLRKEDEKANEGFDVIDNKEKS